MKFLISGFNARPIAKAAKKAGYDIGTIDYFGDMDLINISKNCFSVLRQKSGQTLHRPLHRSPPEYLYILSEIMIDEQEDFDGILFGSAFDRHPNIIEKFNQLGPKVYANSPEKFTLIRDKKAMYKIAKDAGFNVPFSQSFTNIEELVEEAKNRPFPLVTRGSGGGGGTGIKYWSNYSELREYFELKDEDYEKEVWLQEYIKGIDASSSVICAKDVVQILSINKQIIGDSNFNSPGDFSYCGNIVPLKEVEINHKLLDESLENVREIFLKLDLVGSNGIDFVIKNDKLFFMEINPRFQGSLECVEYATGHNVVKLHIDAFDGVIHEIPEKPKYHNYSVKGILFSDIEDKFPVVKYPRSKWIVDRTHYNVLLEKGDPFCSIVLQAKSAENGYNSTTKLAEKIMKVNRKN